MGQVRINGVLYGGGEALDVLYSKRNKTVDATIKDFHTEIEMKPTSVITIEKDYQDKVDDKIYFINKDSGEHIDAKSVGYNGSVSKVNSVNVQDALDELYIDAAGGKAKITATINRNGGSAATTESWQSLSTKLETMAANNYNTNYQTAYVNTKDSNKKGNATANDVLEGYTFSNASAANIAGAMTNNGAVSQTLAPTASVQTYTVPKGYHNGGGAVTVKASEIVRYPTLSFGFSHRHYKSKTVITDFNVQGYKLLSKVMSDTANTSSASIIGYKADGTSTTLTTTIGNVSNLNIEPYYKIRIQSTAAAVDDKSKNIKYIGTFTFTS